MNVPTVSTLASAPRAQWRPLYWEPVSGTGERIMVGVVHVLQGEAGATRIIRDDVLDCLFGKGSVGVRVLIDQAMGTYSAAAKAGGLGPLGVNIMGLHAGNQRETAARSLAELLHTAALLCSSLANVDKFDDLDESDAPQQEDVNRRFSTEVRGEVGRRRPELLQSFGRSSELVKGGRRVRFGFFSGSAILHFTVISAVRQAAGVRDARARLWELQRARETSGIGRVALIAAVPRDDDPTLGPKQRDQLRANRGEIGQEADAANMRWHAVTSVTEAADHVIELATQ